MNKPPDSHDERLVRLTEQISVLQSQVDAILERVERLDKGQLKEMKPAVKPVPTVIAQDGVLDWAGRKALLPRIAAVCFMLVVALMLRTVTDNGMINILFGSLLGLSYSSFLVFFGGFLYSRKSPIAPVFPACGLLLLFSIILEVHARFETLSAVMAYFFLLLAGLVVVLIAHRYRAPMLLSLGTVGVALVSMAIDFPNPVFPLLAVVVLAANLSAHAACQRQLCPALRWLTLGLAMLLWMFWAFKLSVPLLRGEVPGHGLYLHWFMPTLAVYWAFYLFVTLRRVTRNLSFGFFESFLPIVNAVGVYWAAWTVVEPWSKREDLLGVGFVIVAVGHFLVSGWLARVHEEGAPGSNIFTFAGSILLLLALPSTLGGIIWALPVWSVTALVLGLLSGRWASGGVRVTSYLLQVCACLTAVSAGALSVAGGVSFVSFAVALIMTVTALLHYRWCRGHKPVAKDSAYFSWLDKNDFGAVSLLVVGLVSGYYFSSIVLHFLLNTVSGNFDNVFRCGQTVLINAGALLLLVAGARKRNVEIILVAVTVAVFGALKVFVFDMFSANGMPLVFSVFSFGVVAAVGSVVSGRWQQGRRTGGAQPLKT